MLVLVLVLVGKGPSEGALREGAWRKGGGGGGGHLSRVMVITLHIKGRLHVLIPFAPMFKFLLKNM